MSTKEEFKEIIHALISSIGASCSEYELRRLYWNEAGETVEKTMQKVSPTAVSFLEFLKRECSDFCSAQNQGKQVMVYRKSSVKSQHLDHFTRSGQRNMQSYNNFQPPFQGHQNKADNFALQPYLNSIEQNRQWYNANARLLCNPNLSPIAASIALEHMRMSAHNVLVLNNFVQQCYNGALGQHVQDFQGQNLIKKQQLEEKCSTMQKCEIVDSIDFEIPHPYFKYSYVMEVFIMVIESSSVFGFQYDEEGLSRLVTSMNDFYVSNESLRIEKQNLTSGLHVAANIFGCWHRAKLLSITEGDQIKVEFVDFGTCSEVSLRDVRFLSREFASIPIKYLRGRLSAISKASWSSEAGSEENLFEKALNQKLSAKVRGFFNAEKSYELELMKPNSVK